MHEEREEKDIERKTRKNQGSNEGSSSDTEKTSGSLFNTNNSGIELSRIKELPTSFYNGYASFDEFLSATSASDNQLQAVGKNEQATLDRHHQEHRKSLYSNSSNMSGVVRNLRDSVAPGTAIMTSALKQQHRAQDVIDEMNRQYDHNLCLDRFINEMEKLRKKKQEKDDKKPENSLNCRQLASNSSPSTCSSVAPNSNEDTDSGSRNSESIESSTPESGKTPENRKTDKDQRTDENSSSKDDKKKVKSAAQKSSNTRESKAKTKASTSSVTSSSVTSSRKKTSLSKDSKTTFTSESGIEVAFGSSSMELSNSSASTTQDGGSQDKNKNYKGGKLGRKRKRGYIYNPQPVIGKPPKKIIPVEAKDQSYWDKRQRNNEAAKKSREMRRLKVKETHERLTRLKKENEALRVAITLLIQRNENLEVIIDDYEKETPHYNKSPTALTCG